MTTGVKAAAIAAALGGRSPGARSPTARRSGSRERLWASSRPSRPDSPHSSREPERGGAKIARVVRS
jgi:hypothetical protein